MYNKFLTTLSIGVPLFPYVMLEEQVFCVSLSSPYLANLISFIPKTSTKSQEFKTDLSLNIAVGDSIIVWFFKGTLVFTKRKPLISKAINQSNRKTLSKRFFCMTKEKTKALCKSSLVAKLTLSASKEIALLCIKINWKLIAENRRILAIWFKT